LIRRSTRKPKGPSTGLFGGSNDDDEKCAGPS